ncbi:lysine biosynthesis enzyme LysX, partial [mine drainage metagenome]
MSDGFSLGIFYTIIRPEEKALLAAAEARAIPVERIDDGETTFGLDRPAHLPTVVLNRSVSHTRSLYATRCFAHYGVPTVNAPEVVELAGDKILSSLRFAERGIPTPRTVIALSPEAAMRAIEQIGYPAVLKPAVGSWGRLMAKVDDAEEAEQILEHKAALTSPLHSVIYV